MSTPRPLNPYEVYRDDIDREPIKISPGPPTGLLENFRAARTMQDADNSDYLDRLSDEAYAPLVDAVNELRQQEGLTAVLLPSQRKLPGGRRPDPGAIASAYGYVGQAASREEAEDALMREVARLKRAYPGALKGVPDSRDALMKPIIAREQAKRAKAADVLARGDSAAATIGGFAGGVTKAMEDPYNLLTLPIGGSGINPALSIGRKILITGGREGLINGLLEFTQQAQVAENRAVLGEELTPGEAVMNVGGAAIGGGLLAGLLTGAGAAGAKLLDKAVPLDRKLASALEAANVDNVAMLDQAIARGLFDEVPDADLADFVRALKGDDALTPTERAAITAIERQAEIDAVNPYVSTGAADDVHADSLLAALDAALRDAPPVMPRPTAPLPAGTGAVPMPQMRQASADIAASRIGEFDLASYKARNRVAESGGNDRAQAGSSSATGRYQFVRGTFKQYWQKVFGGSEAEAERAWQTRRFDGQVQEALMDRFTADNVSFLRRIGASLTNGNVYLAHFLGTGGAGKLLRASADTPVEQLLDAATIEANKSILRGKSASEVIAWAHRKMGGKAASVSPAGAIDDGDTAAAILRDEALQLRREAAEIQGVGRMEFQRFDPDELTVDAGLMQFKAGGDAMGVTDRLQGVETWSPMLAGRVVVWAADDGRMLIADGHQRMGLARRIKAADPAQRPMLDAIVLREADGFDAESVRVWAALKNIAEGTGTAIDAAKIMRGMGVDEAMKFVPPRSALVRDGAGLARLGDDAFGAVVNELVNPGHAAIVGRLATDPGEQKALIDLLIRLKPESIAQADSIVRQGKAAGFNTETQTDMFGSLDVTASLMMERARVLERGLGELKKLKQVFSTTARNADTLDAAGNRINREASAQEALDNAQAIDIVNRLAFRSGPIGDALDAAARRLAEGGRIGDVVRDFVGAVRGLDLGDLTRLAGSGADAADGRIADGGGRLGDVAEADGALATGRGYSGEPDQLDGGWPSLDEIEAAGQTGFDIFDAPQLKGFDQPGGEAARIQADSLAHDLRMVADAPAVETPEQIVARRVQQSVDETRQAIQRQIEQEVASGRYPNGPPTQATLERFEEVIAAEPSTNLEILYAGEQFIDQSLRKYFPEEYVQAIISIARKVATENKATEVGRRELAEAAGYVRQPVPEAALADPADMFGGATRDERRQALERRGDGGMTTSTPQRPVGSDGGLFDTGARDQTELRLAADQTDQAGLTFNIDGEERALGDLLDEHASDMAAIEAARKCML